jgi:pimeloyl-ACP methyl ester carboxylesterase
VYTAASPHGTLDGAEDWCGKWAVGGNQAGAKDCLDQRDYSRNPAQYERLAGFRAVFTGLKETDRKSRGAVMTSVRQSFERVAGCTVSVQRGGSGPPMLFLHGARGAARWLPFMEALSARFDLIVPEHPGFGRSETPPWLDNISDLAYFYLDFIEALGLRHIHLVGTSLGGWIAAELAVRNQHGLRTLTLVAPAGIHVKGVQPGDFFLWPAAELARNLFCDASLAEAMLREQPSEEEQEMLMKNRFTTAKLAWQPRLFNPHLAKWLHRITIPTLILWGDQDKVMPPPYGLAFRDLIPRARLEILPQCGHLPQVEKMEEFVGAVTRFIEGTRP